MKNIIELISLNPCFGVGIDKINKVPDIAFAPKSIEQSDSFTAFLDNDQFEVLGGKNVSGYAFFGSKELINLQVKKLEGYFLELVKAKEFDLPFAFVFFLDDFGMILVFDDYDRQVKMRLENDVLRVSFGVNAGGKKLLEVLNDEDNASSPCFNWVVGESIFDSKFSSHEQLKNKALSLLSALTNKE